MPEQNCEICGIKSSIIKSIEVDGGILNVCEKCSRFGTVVKKPKHESTPPAPTPTSHPFSLPIPILKRLEKRMQKPVDIYDKMFEKEVVFDYSQRIKSAREAKGWTQEELGKKINEKRSVITKLESGNIIPSNELVKKLERILGIKLIEEKRS